MLLIIAGFISGPSDVLRLLGVLRYFDVPNPDEEYDEASELSVHCSTHAYTLKTEGVSVRVVIPSLESPGQLCWFDDAQNQNEDLFSISASFVAQMTEEFLNLTVTAGNDSVGVIIS